MKNEIVVVIAWHDESDPEKIACFLENKRSFELHNPSTKIYVAKNPFLENDVAWLSSDLSIFTWYRLNRSSISSKRFLLIEWDCWCDVSLESYFSFAWDQDIVGPCVKYPERDDWYWFSKINDLPAPIRMYATGIVPFCGILVSEMAMNMICDEILKAEYAGLNSELRFATIATALGLDPVPNPVASRSLTWRKNIPFDHKYRGLHHPRKRLIESRLMEEISSLETLDKDSFPRIIHQTWPTKDLPSYFVTLSNTWKDSHPEWKYVLWTDDMNKEFISKFYPEFLDQYNSYQVEIERVDAVRYFILMHFGGVFIDMDFECLKNIDDLIQDAECFFSVEPDAHCEKFNKQKILCNAFMGCKPGNIFFKSLCQSLEFTWNYKKSIEVTLENAGPFALTKIYDAYIHKSTIKIIESEKVYPLTAKEARMAIKGEISEDLQMKVEKAYAVHYFLGTWYTQEKYLIK
ncbi:hypothetical protein PBAL39_15329 [Pedobacter sp. BAL39]|uniref:glycosyltransferase family 32 protein n=1 Tax=Pedobacter sp. BAL39 TaxID=391596 RepID=UPI0001559CB2|nr:glycosyltransferase [Pedobacter sp. BAL39]EDM37809.1 hypothetical protein PBAL39_15329 [Pedobacter sp. BAL39]